jgi:hypothetical protein
MGTNFWYGSELFVVAQKIRIHTKSSYPFALVSLAGGSPEKARSSGGLFIERRDGGDPLSLSRQHKNWISTKGPFQFFLAARARENHEKLQSRRTLDRKARRKPSSVHLSRRKNSIVPEMSVPILAPCDRARTKQEQISAWCHARFSGTDPE